MWISGPGEPRRWTGTAIPWIVRFRTWNRPGGYHGSVLDTSVALLAYSMGGGHEGADIQGALDTLGAQPLPDNPIVVAYLLRAVVPYQASHAVSADLMDSAAAWLNAEVDDSHPPLIRAAAAFALSKADRYPSKVQTLLDDLLAARAGEGAWEEDAYITAVAVRALSAFLGTDDPELGEYVYIPDALLRQYINQTLGRNSGDSITRGELLRLTDLMAPDAGITDLTGLEMAVNLATVDISGNAIEDLSPLASLENLTGYAFSAVDDSAVTAEDSAISIPVLDNDPTMVVEGQDLPLSVIGVSAPAHGAASFAADSITYIPSADYNGTDGFGYSASDGQGGVATANVTVTIDPVNDPPSAVDDGADTTDGEPVTIGVLDNDDDVDGDVLTVQSVGTPAHGAALLETEGRITYTPDAGFTGTDSFDYTLGDGALTQSATVTVAVNPAPHTYYILNPLFDNGDAYAVSLAENNTVTAGGTTLILNRDERGAIPAIDLAQGAPVTGSGVFDLAGDSDATDMPASTSLAGDSFVIPQGNRMKVFSV
ncbi:MAG: hypothetical protein BECKG1743D_GA0114223_100861 [Candidatus Kentron sp. G]|nr:MAG: hypothetical protein BECKG1743F_GA0114225_100112 [Candidatus Kentron sp. G]VFM96977.1 MAG: hypothetical protein BECKG1743E_GA0114224_101032 [Candidatus Kentron sp. G]VFM98828.1 MAG: hypothetical protein BECKG1743D_GA0114223_100861 [Candidatus Kentron sp. G]